MTELKEAKESTKELEKKFNVLESKLTDADNKLTTMDKKVGTHANLLKDQDLRVFKCEIRLSEVDNKI